MLRFVASRSIKCLMFLLVVLFIPFLSGCGGESTPASPVTSQDAGTWRGNIQGRSFSTDSVPGSQQTGPLTLELKADRSFTANLTLTTYEPGSTTTVQSVRDVELSAIPNSDSLSNITNYTGTLTRDGMSFPVQGELLLVRDGSRDGPLSLNYSYNDGREWRASARLKK